MISNYTIIRQHIADNIQPDHFYFLQIIKRRKENPGMNVGQSVLKSYYITSTDYLDRKWEQIQQLCDSNNARAYINMNIRSYEKTTVQMIKYLADAMLTKQYTNCQNAFEKIAGRNNADANKKWILDIDTKDEVFVHAIMNLITDLKPVGSKVQLILPTKNGYHLICKPFDPRVLKAKYPDIEIKKDNPTILYIP